MASHDLTPFCPAWAGFHIDGDTLTTDTGETYTAHELRFMRWERNQWASTARGLQREMERAGTAGATWFSDEEWRELRKALLLLDAKLPGMKIRPETGRRVA